MNLFSFDRCSVVVYKRSRETQIGLLCLSSSEHRPLARTLGQPSREPSKTYLTYTVAELRLVITFAGTWSRHQGSAPAEDPRCWRSTPTLLGGPQFHSCVLARGGTLVTGLMSASCGGFHLTIEVGNRCAHAALSAQRASACMPGDWGALSRWKVRSGKP